MVLAFIRAAWVPMPRFATLGGDAPRLLGPADVVRSALARGVGALSVYCCLKPCCTASPGLVVVASFLLVSAGHGAPAACHRFTFAAYSSRDIGIGFRPSPGFQAHATNLSSVRCSTS